MRDHNLSQSDRGYILVFKFWSHFRAKLMENVIRNVTVSETPLCAQTGNDLSQYWVSAKTMLWGYSTLCIQCPCAVASSDSAYRPHCWTHTH